MNKTIVIFGATGDLSHRKLIPALYNLFRKDRLTEGFRIVGFARRPYTQEAFRQEFRQAVQTYSPETYVQATWEQFADRLYYFQGDLERAEDYDRFAKTLSELENGLSDRLYYCATAPTYYPAIARNLGAAEMTTHTSARRDIVVEKPFGSNLGLCPRPQPDPAPVLLRETGFPYRSLPGQRYRPKYFIFTLCQCHLRAGLEP